MCSPSRDENGLVEDNPHPEDENTPLLGQRRQSHESRPVLSNHQDQTQPNTSKDEIDEDVLDVDLVRTMSTPRGMSAEPVPPLLSQRKSFSGSLVVEGYNKVQSEENEEEFSRFIGVSPARFWFIFGGILFGYFLAMFDSTLMASSHPVITSYFHASNSASWLSTVFLLSSTSFQPLTGRISDTFGRRPVYLFAIVVFLFATAWCASAQSIGSFIMARAICGLGAGGVGSMGSIMTSDLIRLEYRGVYQSYINLTFGLGGACGAAFGGVLCDTLGWRAAFGVQVPLLVIYLCVALATTPSGLGPNLAESENKTLWETIKSFDIAGSALLTSSVAFLILGFNLGGNILSWGHPAVIIFFVLFFVCALCLIRTENKAKRPVIPMEVLFHKPRANIVFHNFFSNMVVNTIIFNAPLYFQAVKLESPTDSGLRLAAPSFFLTVGGVSTGFIITYTRRMTSTLWLGSLFVLLGAICTTCMWRDMPNWLSVIFITPASTGQGFSFPSTTMAILAVSTQQEMAVVTTTLSLFRSLGTVMGVSISSLILQNALLAYLNQMVTGENRADIILQARRSVQGIKFMDPFHQNQVINAYAAALRVTFLSGVIFSVLVILITIPIRLPRLGKRH